MSGNRVFIDKQNRPVYQALAATASAVRAAAQEAGLDRIVMELVNLRVSQLNGCAYCLDLHTRQALDEGETPQRLSVLPAWRDTALFTDTERAALGLAEALTLLPDGEHREEIFAKYQALLSVEQFSVLSWAVVTMNAFNRVSIISGHPVKAR
ncbi:carboxymuconolactone decarboxylase family protein [Arthrobacter sp. Sa2CUA1]|uniref:Carboxymuconolactone decarboxylase family protein n=1 Tax=Arthrobacter gallicola TaxID=2762225 RepID=A0ABR8UPL4_9MICC|nr:carboxymuconolactone decarboxylase family protein [Arthrobacter gallicola]MBD7994508.1 carboxymuconolactone decarboxylase family protein [Arthrobacter gallicola]